MATQTPRLFSTLPGLIFKGLSFTEAASAGHTGKSANIPAVERFSGPGVPELWVGDQMDGPLPSPKGTEFGKIKDILKMDGNDGSQQWGCTKAIELYTLKLLKMENFMLFKMYS